MLGLQVGESGEALKPSRLASSLPEVEIADEEEEEEDEVAGGAARICPAPRPGGASEAAEEGVRLVAGVKGPEDGLTLGSEV